MFRHHLASVLGRRRPRTVQASARRRRMAVESLEGRQLMTVDFTGASALGGQQMTVNSMAKDAAGDTYTAGTFAGAATFSPAGAAAVSLVSRGSSDAFLAKYDPAGNLLWVRDLGGAAGNTAAASGLALDAAGNATVVGQFSGAAEFNAGGPSARLAGASAYGLVGFAARYDASGNYLWAKAFDDGIAEAAKSVALDAAGNAYVAGVFWGSAGQGNFGTTASGAAATLASVGGTSNGYVLKLDAAGNTVWASGFGGSAPDQATRVVADAAGNLYVAGIISGTATAGGTTLTSRGGTDIFLEQLSAASGSVQWATSFGGPGSDSAGALALDASGNVLLGGTFYGSVALGGSTISSGGAGTPGGFVAKVSPAGAVQWASALSATQGSSVNAVAVDSAGSVYAGGNFTGVASLGGSPVYSSGSADAFAVKLSSTGAFQWQVRAGGPGIDTLTALALGGVDQVTLAGTYSTPAIFGATTLVGAFAANDYFAQVGVPAVAAPSGTISYTGTSAIGGTSLTESSMAKDAAGNTYTAGTFGGTVNFAPVGSTAVSLVSKGTSDAFLAKYSPTGALLWVRDLGGAAGNTAAANGVVVDAAGNATLVGQFSGSAEFNPGGASARLTGGGVVGFAARYDASGNYVWARAFTDGVSESAKSVDLDAAGNAYIAGVFWGSGGRGNFGTTASGAAATAASVGYGSNGYVLKLDAAGNTVWANGFGGTSADQATRVAADAAGNVYVAGILSGTATVGGTTLTSRGGTDVFLEKLSAASGSVQWATSFGGPGSDSTGGLAVDATGNVYLGGTFYGSVAIGGTTINSGGTGTPGGFLAKYSPAGGVQWASALSSTQGSSVNDVKVDSAGSVYIGGNFTGVASLGGPALYSGGGADPFLVKLNSAGTFQWQMRAGGPGNDTLTALAVGGTDNVTTTGSFNTPALFGPTTLLGTYTTNFYFAQESIPAASSTPVPAALGITGASAMGGQQMIINSMAKDAAGDTYTAGTFAGAATFSPAGAAAVSLVSRGSSDAFLAKYDPAGNLLWVRDLGGAAGNTAAASGLALDAAGNATVVGQFSGAAEFNAGGPSARLAGASAYGLVGFAARYDASGNYLWAKAFDDGIAEAAKSVALDAAGNAYVAGVFWGSAGQGNFGTTASGAAATLASVGGTSNGYVLKLDAAGNTVWASGFGGSAPDQATRVVADAAGNLYVAGIISGTATAGGTTLTSRGGTDIFLEQLSAASGSVQWATSFGGPGSDSAGALALDASGNVLLGGTFYGSVALGGSTISSGGAGTPGGFVAKVSPAGAVQWASALSATQGSSVNAVAVDSAGSVYAGGNFTGVASLGGSPVYSSGSADAFAVKLSSTGAFQWQVRAGGPGIDTLTALALGGVDQVTLAGTYSTPAIFGATTLVGAFAENDYFAQVGY